VRVYEHHMAAQEHHGHVSFCTLFKNRSISTVRATIGFAARTLEEAGQGNTRLSIHPDWVVGPELVRRPLRMRV